MEDQVSYHFATVKQSRQNRQKIEYQLKLRQQPKQSRMCGVGEKADRRPIDPPPIVQLKVNDPNLSTTDRSSYLQNPYYFMYASLMAADLDEELHLLRDGKTRSTTGSVVSSLYHLKDIDNSDAGFFVFPDLSVRVEGNYRLKLSLFEIIGKDVFHCRSIISDVFIVYSAKKFPGMEESTFLSRAFADQGLKIRIRKELRRQRRRLSRRKDSDDVDTTFSEPETTKSGKRVRNGDDDEDEDHSPLPDQTIASITDQSSETTGILSEGGGGGMSTSQSPFLRTAPITTSTVPTTSVAATAAAVVAASGMNMYGSDSTSIHATHHPHLQHPHPHPHHHNPHPHAHHHQPPPHSHHHPHPPPTPTTPTGTVDQQQQTMSNIPSYPRERVSSLDEPRADIPNRAAYDIPDTAPRPAYITQRQHGSPVVSHEPMSMMRMQHEQVPPQPQHQQQPVPIPMDPSRQQQQQPPWPSNYQWRRRSEEQQQQQMPPWTR
ncbi:velvet factor-domain-containing protein [Phascolomyces articulosus]|uniref:Velvet factor-domain-containing protein n=2 Tax=Lichtheimiaceae TaxID=499202 RepID=A0AAD5JYD4_9FUNG|nr:velvet factor-domain-containing protein [Phascolomyces articulosus]